MDVEGCMLQVVRYGKGHYIFIRPFFFQGTARRGDGGKSIVCEYDFSGEFYNSIFPKDRRKNNPDVKAVLFFKNHFNTGFSTSK